MLVEVNLIEKKERKNLFFMVTGIVIFVCLLIWSLVFLYYQTLYNQHSNLQAQLKNAEQLRKTAEKNRDKNETVQAVKSLKNAVNWAKSYPFSTSLLLRKMSNLLPERGYIVSFQLTGDSALLVDIKFDTKKEAAYYLKNLEEAKFVEEVNLNSITEEEFQNETGNPPRYMANYAIKLNKESLKQGQDR